MTLKADDRMSVAMDLATTATRLEVLAHLIAMEESPYAQQYIAKVVKGEEHSLRQVHEVLQEGRDGS